MAVNSSNGNGYGHDRGNGRGHEEHGNGNGYGHVKHGDGTVPSPDYTDGQITVVTDDGRETMSFSTFAEALGYADNGDTLQVGAGTYSELIELNKDVTILGEAGAVISGAGFESTTAQQTTIELLSGASGSTISGLTVVAVSGGNAVSNEFGVQVSNVDLTGNTFSAGSNTSGALVYLNPGASDIDITGNTFEGPSLVGPLLGLDVTDGYGPTDADIDITGNTFGDNAGGYPEVEIFNDLQKTEVTLTGNTGIDSLTYGSYA